jgi:hypothetical protein
VYAFGLSNHSPDQAMASLVAKGIIDDPSEIAVLPSNIRLRENKKPIRSVLFILNVSDFLRNLNVLNSVRYENVQVFIFASPLRVRELQNVTALDFDVNPAANGLGFTVRKDMNMPLYKRVLRGEGSEEVSKVNTHYLGILTDNVKRGSLLNPLMTFIYTLPSSTHQTPIKEAVAHYLYKSLTFKQFEDSLDALRNITITKRVRDRLKEILTSEIGENYRKAFKALSSEKDATIKSVCETFHTSDYELKYIQSIAEASGIIKKVKSKTAVH